MIAWYTLYEGCSESSDFRRITLFSGMNYIEE